MKKKSILFLLALAFSAVFNTAYSQNQHKPTRQSSLEAFSNGDFQKAYSEFNDLLKIYPRDPLYKYYAGVSLVKLAKNASEAETLLSQAVQSGAALKSLPSDAGFYLGRAHQMNGNFSAAEDAYNKFSKEAGKKTAKELNVPGFIQQCSEGRGKITERMGPDEINSNSAAKTTAGNINNPQQNMSIQKQELPKDVDKVLDKAIDNQRLSDSLANAASQQKTKVTEWAGTGKTSNKADVMGDKAAADSVQKTANDNYKTAERMMNPGVKTKEEPVLVSGAAKSDSLKKNLAGKKSEVMIAASAGSTSAEPPIKQQQGTAKSSGVYSAFGMTKPVNDPAAKIETDPVTPEGLVYRIQIAVFRNPVAPSFFKGIFPVYAFTIPNTDKKVYYAGVFRKAADASKALISVRSKGFKDAFVVGMNGSKSVSSDRAAVMEKEWGNKPLMNIPEIKTGVQEEIDTIPPTLVFRVEVARSEKPLKEDIVENYRRFAGKRGLDIITLPDGNITYLIGYFITFESATEYASLLSRNGYKDARVVSWIGRREIPIETAKQLFENLK